MLSTALFPSIPVLRRSSAVLTQVLSSLECGEAL